MASYIEAKKYDYIKEIDFNDDDLNWVEYMITTPVYDCGSAGYVKELILILKEWEKNKPSLEILKDLKIKINSYGYEKYTFLTSITQNLYQCEYINKIKYFHNVIDDDFFELLRLLKKFGLKYSDEERLKCKKMLKRKIFNLRKFKNTI